MTYVCARCPAGVVSCPFDGMQYNPLLEIVFSHLKVRITSVFSCFDELHEIIPRYYSTNLHFPSYQSTNVLRLFIVTKYVHYGISS